ncbi:MAG: hypothetical protein KIB44_24450 [Serratia marcescens]|nr:hypothetical protein [Serratia marcescens]
MRQHLQQRQQNLLNLPLHLQQRRKPLKMQRKQAKIMQQHLQLKRKQRQQNLKQKQLKLLDLRQRRKHPKMRPK